MCRHTAAAPHPGPYRAGCVSPTTGNVLDMYESVAWAGPDLPAMMQFEEPHGTIR